MGIEKDYRGLLTMNNTDFGQWDAVEGGEYDAEETKYTPFDEVERTYLSNKKTGNVTLSRDYRPERDGAILKAQKQLHASAAKVVLLDKGADGNYQQNRDPYTGLVKSIIPPNYDSDGNAISKIQVVVTVGTPG